MFMHIYKLSDNKYHLSGKRNGCADCGKDMVFDSMREDRIIGCRGSEQYPDPDINDVCPKCFSFLPAFNSPGNAK